MVGGGGRLTASLTTSEKIKLDIYVCVYNEYIFAYQINFHCKQVYSVKQTPDVVGSEAILGPWNLKLCSSRS